MKFTEILTHTGCSILIGKIINHPVHHELLINEFPKKIFIDDYLSPHIKSFLPNYDLAIVTIGTRFGKEEQNFEMRELFYASSILNNFDRAYLEDYLEREQVYLKNIESAPSNPRTRKPMGHSHLMPHSLFKVQSVYPTIQIEAIKTSDSSIYSKKSEISKLNVYGEHLLSAASSHSLSEAMAATLPYLYLYQQLGKYFYSKADKTGPNFPMFLNSLEPVHKTQFLRLVLAFQDHTQSIQNPNEKLKIIKAAQESFKLELAIYDELLDRGIEYLHEIMPDSRSLGL